MKKNKLLSYISLGVCLLLFNVIALVIPTEKTATFWIAYAFTTLAFLLQIPLWKITFSKAETMRSKFLGLPIIHIGVGYLFIQLIAFLVFMIFPNLPEWLAIVVSCLILGLSVLFSIAGHIGASEINRLDEKIKIKRFFIQSMQVDIEMLAEKEENEEVVVRLKELIKLIRASDPMSHEMLGELESRISEKVDTLKTAANKLELIGEIELLIIERNKKTKMMKG